MRAAPAVKGLVLRTALPIMIGSEKLHQFLSDIGVKACVHILGNCWNFAHIAVTRRIRAVLSETVWQLKSV